MKRLGKIFGGISLFVLGAAAGSYWTVGRIMARLADPEARKELLDLVDEALEEEAGE